MTGREPDRCQHFPHLVSPRVFSMKSAPLCVGFALLFGGLSASGQEKKPVKPTARQIEAARGALAKLGARFDLLADPQTNWSDVVVEMPFNTTDAYLKTLHRLPVIPFPFQLSLINTQVTGDGLRELKALKYLSVLHLGERQLTDKGIRALREINMLHVLSNAKSNDDQPPAKAADVTSFNLRGTNVTDAGLKELKNLNNLTSLILNGTKVTDAGLKELKAIKELTVLSLGSTKVTDAGLNELKYLLKLARLGLEGTNLTDAGLKELKDLKSLTALDLSFTQVSDSGIKELKDLKSLTVLVLGSTKVTDAGARELQQALPRCKIQR